MGLVERWLGGSRQKMTSDELVRILRVGSESKSGTTVTVDTALRVATVFACCRRIAGGIARLPFRLYQVDEDGVRRVATEHPLHTLINRRPNATMTSFEWRETSMFHALLARGAHSFINRVRGEVRAIEPIPPSMIVPKLDPKGLIAFYEVAFADGSVRQLAPNEVFRVPGPSWSGRQALEMIDIAREAIGLSIATEESLARLHKSGVRPAGILTTDGTLQPATVKRAEEKLNDEHAGKPFGVAVFDAGLKYQAMSMTAHDAQSMELRAFQVAEIARMFEISPMMIGHPDKTATYASAEAFMQDFVNNTLGPWIERWEQATSRDLLTEDEVAEGYYVKLDVRGLLRGDAKTRAEFYKSGILTGWMTRNEAREKEDLDPIDGLDDPLVPLNMGGASEQDQVDPATEVDPVEDPVEPVEDPGTKAARAVAEGVAAGFAGIAEAMKAPRTVKLDVNGAGALGTTTTITKEG